MHHFAKQIARKLKHIENWNNEQSYPWKLNSVYTKMNCILTKTFLMMRMMMIKGINNNCYDGYDNVNIIVKYFDNKHNRESSKSSKCRV